MNNTHEMNMYSLRRVLFWALPISAIISVITWWAMHDRQHESSVSTDSWKGGIVTGWIHEIPGRKWEGSDAKPIRETLEKNSPLAALCATDPGDPAAVSRVLRDLEEFYSWGRRSGDPGGAEWRREKHYWDVGSGFLVYRVAILADDCPQTERTQYCDTLLHLLRLRNSARDDKAMDDFLMTYLTADWYLTCRTFDVPNDELENKFMELGWFRFLRTGILPDGWTMRDVGAGAKNPQGLSN